MSNNLFNVLNFSDTEEVPEQQQKKSKKNNNNKEQIIPVEQVQKENTKHDNPVPKQKGVPADPHPKDRQSGTGRGKEQRKEGGGRNNWGNYKDDLKEDKYVAKEQKTQDTPKEESNEQTTVQPPAPEKTLADYYQQRGANVEDVLKKTETKPQVVKQIDEEALKKDKLFVMKTREDEKKQQEQKQKKTRQQQTYRSELNTQGAEYLGFTNQVQEPERKNERRGERRQQQQDKQEPVQEQQQESETQVQGEKVERNERENRQGDRQDRQGDRQDRQGDRQNKGYKRDRQQDRPQHDRQNRDNNTRDQRRGDKQRRGDDRQDKKPQQRQQEQGIQLDDKDFPSL